MKRENIFTGYVQSFLDNLLAEIKQITGDQFVGCYLHGSLSMGSFQPGNSDIDLLVVLNKALSTQQKQRLAALFLSQSKHPYPVEVSFLLASKLKEEKHPFSYLFHYSEYWRERMEVDKKQVTEKSEGHDADLAAHIAVLLNRGITLEGAPADRVFPQIPRADFISSIQSDYNECLMTYMDKPVYALLNMLRFYWYLKEGCILSKVEAGERAYEDFPENMLPAIQSLLYNYQVQEADKQRINKQKLTALKNLIDDKIKELLRQ